MDIKTILVHVDRSRSAEARVRFAAGIALAHGAHLVGLAQTGIQRYLYGSLPDTYMGDLTPLFADLRAIAEQSAARFDELARQAGVASFEHRIGDEEPGYALASQALLADLVVVGQSDPQEAATAHAAIPEYVALHATCPVLVVPYLGQFAARFERVLLAWNASPESARALRQALPWLARAREVEIGTFARGDGGDDAFGGADAALFLARHGVRVTLHQAQADGDVGEALLARASDTRADLLVMGCYGHSRLREIVLGGASRTVLRSMTLPVLLAH